MTDPRDLLSSVASPVSDARVRRQRLALIRALERRDVMTRRKRAPIAIASFTALGIAVAAAAVFGVIPLGDRARPSREGAELAAGMTTALDLVLSDGSEVTLEPGARLRVVRDRAEGQVVELSAGESRFHVTSDAARVFEVRARDAVVRVIGTRFRVAMIEDHAITRLEVDVVEGRVHVQRGDDQRVLSAGERWVVMLELPVAVAAPADRLPDAASSGSDGADEVAAREPSVRARRSAMTERHEEASESADALFERARVARRDGRDRDAANAYSQLVRDHARDPRAGLAAFELGRLLLDRLNDPQGAIAAFRRAGAARGSHREDASARLVEAYEQASDVRGCRAAQSEYLRRYSDGVHADAVRSRCP